MWLAEIEELLDQSLGLNRYHLVGMCILISMRTDI
jgi:hypothetical protein